MDYTFIYLPSEEGEILLNVNQIVRVDGLTNDKVVLHTSDGHTIHIHGSDYVSKLISLLVDQAVELDGRPLSEVFAEADLESSKLRLVKPEPEA